MGQITRTRGAFPPFLKVCLIFVIVCFVLYLFLRFLPFPELDAFQDGRRYGFVLESADGRELRVFPAPDGVKREWADEIDIPENVKRVFITAEDKRFYFHPGVDPAAVAAGIIRNARAKHIVSGASTITMQLARLVKPRASGMRGKITEAFDALRLETRLSKKRILELWLNNIPFGSNIEGLASFSRARFGCPVTQLSAPQATALAVVPRRPSRYDPVYDAAASLSAAERLALRCGVDVEETADAVQEAAVGADVRSANPFYAPHFTERARSVLFQEYASRAPTSSKIVKNIRTTLDLDLQLYAEDRLQAELEKLAGNRVSNGAALVIDNKTGAVICYVGSASWFDDEALGKIDGVQARNQPGSCLKPFLYALALDNGFDANAILPDIPSVFGADEAYSPANFNRRFNGPVRMRVALASSFNVPAVWMLSQLGVGRFEDCLVSMGFDSITEGRGSYGTGLALGNAEVSLEELTQAFSIFRRNGMSQSIVFFTQESLGSVFLGNASKDAVSQNKKIFSDYAAFVIADILSDKASRFPGFGTASAFSTPFEAMFKTGTANQYQDIWALGASRRWTAGVWMGNFSGETVVGSTGSSIPARVVSDLLSALETAYPAPQNVLLSTAREASAPEGVKVEICALSGMRAGPYCGGVLTEWIRTRMPDVCDWHHAHGITYPSEYGAWLAERARYGDVRRGSGRIRLPREGAVFYLDAALPEEAQAIRVETAGFEYGALVLVDDVPCGALNSAGVFTLPLSPGKHTVTVEDAESTHSVTFIVR